MELSVNFFMPDISSPRAANTSAIELAKTAEKRGYKLSHTREQDLTYYNGEIVARARGFKNCAPRNTDKPADVSDFYDIDFKKDVDVVMFRPEMNYNLHYLTVTHLFDKIANDTFIVDNPRILRSTAEKLLLTKFPELAPPTLISSDPHQILKFRDEYKDIIVKPLFGYGGEGIFHIKPESDNLGCLLEMFENLYHEPVMIQKYLPEIKYGDKRVIIIDGEPVCGLLRKAGADTARANVSSGGSAEVCPITENDKRICDVICERAKELGLLFVGVDIVGDYVIEINVGTVGGIIETKELGGIDASELLWDAIEKRIKNS